MSNAQPATPLPKIEVGLSGNCNIVHFNGEDVVGVMEVPAKFADYIAEACNSYPELQAKLAVVNEALQGESERYRNAVSKVATLTAEVARLKGLMIKAAGRLVVNRPEDEEGWLRATRVMREVAIQLRDAAALADTEPEEGGE